MSGQGIYAIFEKIAGPKSAFVPMPGGAAPEAPMDPAMAGQDPAMMAAATGTPPPELMAQAGMQVDPAMAAAGGAPLPEGMAPPMDPAAGGGMPIPPEIQAAIDQAVAASTGGGGGSGGGGGGKGSAKADQLGNIETMLTKVIGLLVGQGLLPKEDLGIDLNTGTTSEAPPEAAVSGSLGGPVESSAAPKVASAEAATFEQARTAAESLANLMSRLGGRR